MRLVYEPILPNGYTRLEYLESTGTQYIDTGVYGTEDLEAELVCQQLQRNTSATGQGIFGCFNSTTADSYYLYQEGRYDSHWQIGFGAYSNTNTYIDIQKHTFKFSNYKVYMDGTVIGTLVSGSMETTPYTLLLFTTHKNTGATYPAMPQRFYSVKLIKDKVFVRDFIPALRNSDSEPGMYDRVTGTFFTNVGTGTFSYPTPAKPEDDVIDNPKYQQVSYLQSSGTQYIDTGFIPTNNTDASVTCKYTKNTGIHTIFAGGSAWGNNELLIVAHNNQSFVVFERGNDINARLSGSKDLTNQIHTWSIIGDKGYMDDTEVTTITTSNVSTTNSIALLAYHRNSGYGDFLIGCLYGAKIWENNILVRHLIPAVRKVDNKPGMYDKVTGNFYTNGGTGEFTYGEKVNQKLPDAYEKVKYLQSELNQNQYIDTGLYIDDTCGFKIDCQYSTANDKAMIGVKGENSSRWAYLESGGQVYLSWNGVAGYNKTTLARQVVSINYYNDRKRIWNDELLAPIEQPLEETGSQFSVCLFTAKWGSESNKLFASGKIYSAKISKGNKLIGDFIPVLRKSDNKPGMYDFVSGQFFTNLGTGADFTYETYPKLLPTSKVRLIQTGGYDVIDDLYKRVDYLESTGTQYIDTGIDSTDVDTIFESTFAKRTIQSSSNYLYGADSILTGTQNGKIAFTTIPAVTETFYKTRLEYTVGQNRKIYVNDEYIGEASNYHAVFRIRLFSLMASQQTYSDFMIKETKITMEGKLVRHFIPVIRISDNKPGMYDKVTRTFFTNAGTGEFLYPTPTYVKPIKTRYVAGGYVASIYKPLQYLQSDGTQYIDTGVNVNDDNKYNWRFKIKKYTSSTTGWRLDGSAYNGENAIYVGIRDAGTFVYGIGNDTYTNIGASVNVPYVYDLNIPSDYYKITEEDGTDIVNITTLTKGTNFNSTGLNLWLFGYSGEARRYAGRIYFANIYNNGVLVRDLIPVLRILDNKPGMYDKVTNTFFTNAGTGEFSYA